VGAPRHAAAAAEEVGEEHADQREAHPLRLDRVMRVGVGNRDDAEAYGVVGDGEEEQELDRRVPLREDGQGDDPREGDVRRGWDAPPILHLGPAELLVSLRLTTARGERRDVVEMSPRCR